MKALVEQLNSKHTNKMNEDIERAETRDKLFPTNSGNVENKANRANQQMSMETLETLLKARRKVIDEQSSMVHDNKILKHE